MAEKIHVRQKENKKTKYPTLLVEYIANMVGGKKLAGQLAAR